MAHDLIPSATPEEGGNNMAATNEANFLSKTNPDKEIKTEKRKIKKWFGYTKTQWKEIAGFLVLVPWLYDDLWDSQEISKLCLLAASIAIAQGVLCSFLNNRIKALAVWLISLVPIASIVWINLLPELKPYPHLTFAIVKPGTHEIETQLTNNFLLNTEFGHSNYTSGVLIFPTVEKSNVVFNLYAKNNGPVFAEYAVIGVSIPIEFSCRPDPGWVRCFSKTTIGYTDSSGVNKVNATDEWLFEVHNLLPGNGIMLPALRFSNITAPPNSSCGVLTRAKDSPAQELDFQLIFFPVSTNSSVKPFVLKSNQINGHGVTIIPPELSKELIK